MYSIAPYFQSSKFRVDESDPQIHGRSLRSYKNRHIWVERLNKSGDPTENYSKIDPNLFKLLITNKQIQQ